MTSLEKCYIGSINKCGKCCFLKNLDSKLEVNHAKFALHDQSLNDLN